MKYMLMLGISMISIAAAMPVMAIPPPPPPSEDCSMRTQANMRVQVFGTANSATAAQKFLEAAYAKITTVIEAQNLDAAEASKKNYSIHANSRSGNVYEFRYQGSVNYKIEPAEKSAPLLDTLVKEGMTGNYEVHDRRVCK